MKKLSLKEIASALGAECYGDTFVTGVSIDSRTIEKGDLYIAVQGENFDGHDFSKSAIEKGAAAVMCHKDIDCDCPKIFVSDTREAFLALASWYRRQFDTFIVGLTGSVGKTTTKDMIASVFQSKKNTLKTEGNLNNSIGVPKTLMRLEEETQAAVVEMGMDGKGQISVLTNCVQPDAAVITNIGVSHLENLGSREGILAAKMEIIEGLKKGGKLFLNSDDPYLMSVQPGEYEIVYFGINNSACKYRAENITANGAGTEFDVCWGGNIQHAVIPAIGKHNVYDALCAFAVGCEYGISPENAAKGLAEYKPSGMRQRLRTVKGITFIEDCYNASPDSVRAAISTLSSLNVKRKIAVLGDMLELGTVSEEAHKNSGMIAAKKRIDAVFTLGEKSAATAEKAKEMGVEYAENFNLHEELVSRLYGFIKEGDAVLFKASRAMKLEDVINPLYEKLNAEDK